MGPGITELNQYQWAAIDTAVYPEMGTGSMLALAYVGLGLGEAGEVQGKIKKILRDNNGVLTAEKREQIIAEMGDVLWYLAMMSHELNTTLTDVATYNIAKLQDRKERDAIKGSGDER